MSPHGQHKTKYIVCIQYIDNISQIIDFNNFIKVSVFSRPENQNFQIPK